METLIQRQVWAVAAASVTFAGIPQTYENLVIKGVAASSDAAAEAQLGIQFNGDVAAHYDWSLNYSSGNATGSFEGVATTYIGAATLSAATAPAGTAAAFQILIPAYARSVFNKVVVTSSFESDTNAAGGLYIRTWGGQWRSTAAINSITLFDQTGGNLVAGSVLSLYGET